MNEGWRVTITTLMNERLAAPLDAGLVHVLRAWGRGAATRPAGPGRAGVDPGRDASSHDDAIPRTGPGRGAAGAEGSVLKLAVGTFRSTRRSTTSASACWCRRDADRRLRLLQPVTMGGTHLVDDPGLDLVKAFLNAWSRPSAAVPEIQRTAHRRLSSPPWALL